MRLIVVLRDPVERAFSHYRRERSLGRENLSFDEALDAEAERLRVAGDADGESFYLAHAYLHHAYATRGLYLDQLRAWEETFPREQILVTTSEELFRHTHETLARVTAFLSLPPHPSGAYDVTNAAPPGEIEPATRQRLIERFSGPNAALYAHLGRDLGWSRP